MISEKEAVMKKIVGLLLVLTLAVGITAALSAENYAYAKSTKKTDASTVTGKAMKITKKTKATTEEMVSGYNGFALKALRTTLKNEKASTNVMISPASLMFAIDMCAMGAKGKTYSQMASLVKKGATKRDLLKFAKYYRTSLESSGVMDIANSIWINESNPALGSSKINEGYLNLLRKYFRAAAATRKFDDTVKDEINAWISDKTKGMIPKTLDVLEQSTLMLIINAMAFEGKWSIEYKDYQINEDGKFTNYAGEEEKAKMLSSEESLYFETAAEKGFLKYYEGRKYAFMAILPNDKDISVNDYVAALPDNAFETFYDSLGYVDVVNAKIPAFSFDYSIIMNNNLKKLGMRKAFDPDADFSLMLSGSSDASIYIGRVIHKTHIELDEKGTKAAAVTVIDVKGESCAPEPELEIKEVILDRPFVFAIVDTETGTPVFAGVVNTVK